MELSTLDLLIERARLRRMFDEVTTKVAHDVRITANKFLHGENPTEAESRETLEKTRGL